GIESAIWYLSQPGSKYEGEKNTKLGDGEFSVTIDRIELPIERVKVISEGSYPDSDNPQSVSTVVAILEIKKGIKILSWKQAPSAH
ncbi:MAG: hypothetical protein HY350_05540, partial [Candidatus Omnitrophica bacterium]|nr:hypothetical protein [Candidatus Omnitrophota bacterium]